jgi:hypothetical protein
MNNWSTILTGWAKRMICRISLNVKTLFTRRTAMAFFPSDWKSFFYLHKIKSFEYPCSPSRPCGLARHDIVSTTGSRSSGWCCVYQLAPCSGVTVSGPALRTNMRISWFLNSNTNVRSVLNCSSSRRLGPTVTRRLGPIQNSSTIYRTLRAYRFVCFSLLKPSLIA